MKKIKNFFILSMLFASIPALNIIAAEDEEESADGGIEEVVVTARRTEESLQDVPIAVTAFSEDGVKAKQIIAGTDLQMNAPNVSFTPTNFGGNSFSIRGIGRLVTAGSGEAGVSMHINDVPIAGNTVTSEYYDIQRVEILRGPQGTLFGRNATGGVINVITRKPEMGVFSGFVEAEIGNYNHERQRFAVNIPIMENVAARVAGTALVRDGYTKNLWELSDGDIDGRDNEEYRISLRWEGDSTSVDLMHNKFEEDSDRSRITNQVCKQNPLPTYGCISDEYGRDGINPGSSTGTMYISFGGIFPLGQNSAALASLGLFEYPRPANMGLREMHTDFEPVFEQESDQTYLTVTHERGDYTYTINAATAGGSSNIMQDYNMDVGPMFLTVNPATGGANALTGTDGSIPVSGTACGYACEQTITAGALGGDIYGTYNRVFSYDRSYTDYADTDYLEFKIQSNLDGPVNFVAGANTTESESHGGYYVMANSLDFISLYGLAPINVPPLYPGFYHSDTYGETDRTSFFAEAYYDVSDDVRLTVGLRRNSDEKSTRDRTSLANAANIGGGLWIRSSLAGCLTGITAAAGDILAGTVANACPASSLPLLDYYGATSAVTAQTVAILQATGAGDAAAAGAAQQALVGALMMVPPTPGYNEQRDINGNPSTIEFNATTGRVVLDWKVNEDTLVYTSVSKGMKPGGFNPPISDAFPQDTPRIFEREEVEALEFGFKTTLLDNRMQLNGSLFEYDYTGLQIYKIINNSSVNVNVDAEIRGAELEMLYIPSFDSDIVIDVMLSLLESEATDNWLLDPKDRQQGDADWIVLKNIDSGSATGVQYIANLAGTIAATVGDGYATCGSLGACIPVANTIYDNGVPAYISRNFLNAMGVATSDGILTNIKGNALPNAPEYTIKVGIAKTWSPGKVDVTARLDYYKQDGTYAREFNRSWDKLPGWYQTNASVLIEDPEDTWNMRLWIRNLTDNTAVTGHYVTSDTSGMYTNYFLTEPRIYGATFNYNF
ncbi:MAG: TonB-dependent receptor [Gammaproteobacteria bacterium]